MDKVKKILDKCLLYLSAILLVIMSGLVIWQVFTRYVLNDPSMFTEELVRIILIWTSFIGASYAFGAKDHMALVFIKERLDGNARKIIEIFIDLVVLLFCVIVLIIGGARLVKGVMGARSPILNIPRSFIYMIAPISGILISIYQVIHITNTYLKEDKVNDKEEMI